MVRSRYMRVKSGLRMGGGAFENTVKAELASQTLLCSWEVSLSILGNVEADFCTVLFVWEWLRYGAEGEVGLQGFGKR